MLTSLLELKCDANETDDAGQTALHLAARAGRTPLVLALLAHGAAVCPRDRRGRTPLHWVRPRPAPAPAPFTPPSPPCTSTLHVRASARGRVGAWAWAWRRVGAWACVGAWVRGRAPSLACARDGV